MRLSAGYPGPVRADLHAGNRHARVVPGGELAAAYPDRYRPGLADSLQVLARVRNDLGLKAETDLAR